MTVESGVDPAPATILLTGAGGQLGRELIRTLAKLGTVVAAARDLAEHGALERVDLDDRERHDRVAEIAVCQTLLDFLLDFTCGLTAGIDTADEADLEQP